MRDYKQFYINGEWVEPSARCDWDVINPASESVVGRISLGNSRDVDKAVMCANTTFSSFSKTSREERIRLMTRILEVYEDYSTQLADAITEEMGAAKSFSVDEQVPVGYGHIETALQVLKTYEFEERLGTTRVFKEPVGVCGFITPWNWPMNQIACKVAPALACGCTIVLKPSELAPLSAYLFTKIMDEAGVPKGAYNMVNGDGPGVGTALASHPDVSMVSFTGSTRAGIQVAKTAADTVKRVAQELGGKSANIILDDADLDSVVIRGVHECFANVGQSCNAPTRMLVPAYLHSRIVEIAKVAAAEIILGDPNDPSTHMGPVANKAQFEKIQSLVQRAIEEGSELVMGGAGRPSHLSKGYYVRPTIFANVTSDMTIAREEVFGPVLAIMPYQNDEEAVRIANDSPYGLSGYVQSSDLERARAVAAGLRTGMVHINGAREDLLAPFGGFKQSGNGREWGAHAFADYLELKSVMGFDPREKYNHCVL